MLGFEGSCIVSYVIYEEYTTLAISGQGNVEEGGGDSQQETDTLT